MNTTPDVTSHSAGAYRPHQMRMLVLAFVAFFASAPGQSFLISVFIDDFLSGTDVSRTGFSALYAAGTVVSALAMLALGRVVDRRGLRIAWIGVSIALAAACGLASIATGALLAFVALALLRTSGHGAFTLVGTLLVARHFDRRRGRAVAVANLGMTVAWVILPPLVAALILQVGWRSAYQVIGTLILLAVLPLAWFVRTGPPRPEPTPDSADPMTHSYPGAVRATRHGLPNVPSSAATRLLLVLAVPSFIGTAVTFHAVSILAERDIGFLAAGGVLGMLGATSAVGVVSTGALVDRVRSRTALLAVSALVLAATLVLLVPTKPAAYAAFAILGLGMGSTGVVNGTIWARTFGTSQLGRIQSTAQSSRITAAALAPLVPAISQSVTGSYQAGLIALAVVAVIALAISRAR